MSAREAWVVVDLGYGDQGKGSVTDFLVRDRGAHTVVRYNGGAQAGHAVVTDDGRRHVFSQIGAGSFVPGVETLLTSEVAIQPWAMMVEAEHLARAGVPDVLSRVMVHERAPVVTPVHRAANRIRERARGDARHGSVGVGVGEAVCDARALGDDDVVRARDVRDARTLREKLRRIQERKRVELAHVLDAAAIEEREVLEDASLLDAYVERASAWPVRLVGDGDVHALLSREGAIVFEGAQGVLLDEHRGFHPYTTWSDCTDRNAARLLEAHAYEGEIVRLGVVRAYATRHGPGAFVTEDAALTARLPDAHNGDHEWQGAFRVGWFDAVATRYAIACCERIDGLAVTCLDRMSAIPQPRIANAYTIDGEMLRDLPLGAPGDLAHLESLTTRLFRAVPVYAEFDAREVHAAIARSTGAPVRVVSSGPSSRSKAWMELTP